MLLCCLSTVRGQANIYGQCVGHLSQADEDQNNFLSQDEFANGVKRITYGTVDTAFTSLPPSLLTAFATRAQGGAGVPLQDEGGPVLRGLCEAVMTGVLDELGVTVNYQRCFLFLSIGDQNRDDALSRDEFSRYVNPASGNQYGSVPFDGLPLPVQLVFDDFTNDSGSINIAGTRPGTDPTAEREVILKSLCRQTLVAVQAGDDGIATTVAPTNAPTPGGVSFTLRYCTAAMSASDRDRNMFLDETEYARFVNTVSQNRFPASQFDLLPEVLQQNFISNIEDAGNIDLFEVRPGPSRSPERQTFVENFCATTQDAINQALSQPAAPTPAPTLGPPEPIPYVKCTLSMVTSDGDRSDSLTQEEYIAFLNRVVSFIDGVELSAWRDLMNGDLPTPLLASFESLAAESATPGIDVTGASPGAEPEPDQQAFLERVCRETPIAVFAALYPKPTSSPPDDGNATKAPTLTGNLTVYNAFIISAASYSSLDEVFAENTNEENLERAYGDLVTKVVAELLASRSRRRLRGLAINGFVEGSPELYERTEIDCPADSDSSACQKIYARFNVDVRDEASPDVLEGELASAVQAAMNHTEGGLQSYLDEIQPDSPIVVVGVPQDGQLRPPTPAPTASPGETPGSPNQPRSSDDGGIGTGLLIGVIIGALLLLCCCGYFIYAGKDGPLAFIDNGPKKRKDTEGSVNQFGDDSPPAAMDNKGSVGESRLGGALSLFGSGGATKEVEEESAGGFSIQEQSPKKSSIFGFGKKSSDAGLGAISPMHGDQDSVADYGFDDATVDPSKAGEEEKSHNASLVSGDWNPQKPPTGTEDPWSDRRRASPSTESEESENDGTGTGYGSSDSESDSESGTEEDIYREDGQDRYENDDGGDSYGDDYDDDYDDNYDDNTNFGDEQTMESDTFRGDDTESHNFNSSAGGLGTTQEFDNVVDQGNWSGIMRNDDGDMDVSATFGNASGGADFGSGPGSPSKRSERSHSRSGGGSRSPRSSRSQSSEDSQKREYIERVRELVRQVVPDEEDNVPAMMEQFAGREEELINTLQTMCDRSNISRARKAVHRSKAIPDETGRFTAGSADGTAAVAAASTIGQGFDSFQDASGRNSYQDGGSYTDGGSYQDGGSYDDGGSYREGGSYSQQSYGDEGSYRDGEGSYTEGGGESLRDDYNDDEYGDEGSGSYGEDYDDEYAGEGSYSRGSYDDGVSYGQGSQGSYSRDSQGSQSRGEGSHSRGEGSYGDGDYQDDYDDDYDQRGDVDSSFGGPNDFDDDDEGSFADEYD